MTDLEERILKDTELQPRIWYDMISHLGKGGRFFKTIY